MDTDFIATLASEEPSSLRFSGIRAAVDAHPVYDNSWQSALEGWPDKHRSVYQGAFPEDCGLPMDGDFLRFLSRQPSWRLFRSVHVSASPDQMVELLCEIDWKHITDITLPIDNQSLRVLSDPNRFQSLNRVSISPNFNFDLSFQVLRGFVESKVGQHLEHLDLKFHVFDPKRWKLPIAPVDVDKALFEGTTYPKLQALSGFLTSNESTEVLAKCKLPQLRHLRLHGCATDVLVKRMPEIRHQVTSLFTVACHELIEFECLKWLYVLFGPNPDFLETFFRSKYLDRLERVFFGLNDDVSFWQRLDLRKLAGLREVRLPISNCSQGRVIPGLANQSFDWVISKGLPPRLKRIEIPSVGAPLYLTPENLSHLGHAAPSTLSELMIGYCEIDDDGIAALAKSSLLRQLTRLWYQSRRVTCDGGRMLAAALGPKQANRRGIGHAFFEKNSKLSLFSGV